MSIRESLPASKTVTLLSGLTVAVPKLHTGDYYSVLLALEDLPAKVYERLGTEFQTLGDSEEKALPVMLRALPRLLALAYNEVLTVIAAATKLSPEFLANETHAEDLLALIDAVLEVNDVAGLVGRLKNMGARLREAGVLKEKAPVIPFKKQ